MPIINYIAEFPIPEKALPTRLRSLLEPVGSDPDERVGGITGDRPRFFYTKHIEIS